MKTVWSLHPDIRAPIIHRMKIGDILQLSMTNKPFHTFLKYNKQPHVELVLMFEGDDWRFTLRNPCGEILIQFRDQTTNSEFFEMDGGLKMKMNGSNVVVENCPNPEEKMKAMCKICRFITEIANVKFQMYYRKHPSEFDIFKSFVFEEIKSFDRVRITSELNSGREVLSDELRLILEDLYVKNLELNGPIKGNELLEGVVFNQKRLVVYGNWIEPRGLLNTGNTQLEELNVYFPRNSKSPEEFVSIGQAWQRGTHFTNLRMLRMESSGKWSGKKKLMIQENGALELVREENGGRFPYFKGYIKRFSDGRMAEVEARSYSQRLYPGIRQNIVYFSLIALKRDYR